MALKKGMEVTLSIEKFADRGKSLARLDGMVVFVNGAVPGDQVRVRIIKKRKQFAEGRLLDILVPSALRTTPRCIHADDCGGCKWQHVNYEAQCAAKHQSIVEALAHQGGFTDAPVAPTIPAVEPFYYRNKMEFSFSAQRWLTPAEIASGERFDTSFAAGLHAPGNFAKVIDLQECYLPDPLAVAILRRIREIARAGNWSAWHVYEQTGFLRHLVTRTGTQTGDVMINLVTNGVDEERMAEVATCLQEEFPAVTTFINTIHTGVSQTSYGEAEHVVFGPGVIHDEIGPYRFEIAPTAFFQTNTRMAERLYAVARDFAEFQPTDLCYDLYCGAGTISLFCSAHVQKMIGIEWVDVAVQNARRNAAANGVTNCTFHSGDMLTMLTPDFVKKHGQPDVILTDPPRAGMHPKVVQRLAELRAPRLVYISCNPITQARDLGLLRDVYTIEAVQPVDLFPHTHHTECVIQLRLAEA